MATKSTEKTAAKQNKSDTAAAKTETSKSETPSSEASAAPSEAGGSDSKSAGGAKSDGGGAKKSSTPSRSISYFSSVSSDEYRSGWDGIFSSAKKPPAAKRAKSKTAKRAKKLPATISLKFEDLEPSTRDQLETLLRQHAKKKRLNYAKLSGNGQIRWQISCHIADA